MKLETRKLEYTDIFECLNIMKENYTEDSGKYWDNVFIKDLTEICNGDKIYRKNCIVVMLDKKIIGFACYSLSKMSNDLYEIFWVNVKKEFQNKGIGKYLMIEVEKDICKSETRSDGAFTIIFETTKPYFYEKIGYKTGFVCNKGHHFMYKSCDEKSCINLYTEKGYKNVLNSFEKTDVGGQNI